VTHYSFCPVCAAALERTSGPVAVCDLYTCRKCGFEFWQNSKPSVAAIVTRTIDGVPHLLLTRRGIDPHKGMWDMPGGYLKNGESPEEGLAREMQEELGTTVTSLELFMTGIEEYHRADVAEEARFVLSLHYRCEVPADGPLRPDDDVAEARWFPLGALPEDIAWVTDRHAISVLVRDLAGPPGDDSGLR
jgi:ADP-ribose pyrophosphatase YjhB (NUDIX family)